MSGLNRKKFVSENDKFPFKHTKNCLKFSQFPMEQSFYLET